MTMRMKGSISRICLASSNPSISGSLASRKISSNRFSFISLSASWPLNAFLDRNPFFFNILSSVHPETGYFEASRSPKNFTSLKRREEITFLYNENQKQQQTTDFGRAYPVFFKFSLKKRFFKLSPISSGPWSGDWPPRPTPAHNI